jgi:prevent-host-death family protein
MHLSADIHSLTDFKSHAKEHLARIRSTGRPEILTVNGRAEAVVLPPALYDRLVELAMGEVREKIGLGLAQADRGELLDADAALAARRVRRGTKAPVKRKATATPTRNSKPRRST